MTHTDCRTNCIDHTRNEGSYIICLVSIEEWMVIVIPANLSQQNQRSIQ